MYTQRGLSINVWPNIIPIDIRTRVNISSTLNVRWNGLVAVMRFDISIGTDKHILYIEPRVVGITKLLDCIYVKEVSLNKKKCTLYIYTMFIK